MSYPMDQSPEHDIVPQEELETVFQRIQAIAGLEPGSLNPEDPQNKEYLLDDHTVLGVSTGLTRVEAGSVEDVPLGVYDECSASIFTKSVDSPLVLCQSIRVMRDIDGGYYSTYIPQVPEDEPWEMIVSRVQGTELYSDFTESRQKRYMDLGLEAILGGLHGEEVRDRGIRAIEGVLLAQEIYDADPVSNINRAQLFAFQRAFESLS